MSESVSTGKVSPREYKNPLRKFVADKETQYITIFTDLQPWSNNKQTLGQMC